MTRVRAMKLSSRRLEAASAASRAVRTVSATAYFQRCEFGIFTDMCIRFRPDMYSDTPDPKLYFRLSAVNQGKPEFFQIGGSDSVRICIPISRIRNLTDFTNRKFFFYKSKSDVSKEMCR